MTEIEIEDKKTYSINLECKECHSLIAVLVIYNKAEFKSLEGDTVCGICKLNSRFNINNLTVNCVLE